MTDIACNDCLSWLRGLEAGSAHLCFVDPPYNRGKHYGDFADNLPWDEYDARAKELVEQMARVSSRGVAIFVPATLSRRWWQWMPDAQQVIIEKGALGNNSGGWIQQYFVLLTTARPLERRYARNLWRGLRLPGEGYYFHEERPDHPGFTCEALVARAIQAFTLPGEIVGDPMMGSGTTAVVAERLGRQWIGCEQNPAYIEQATERLRRARAQTRLPIGEERG